MDKAKLCRDCKNFNLEIGMCFAEQNMHMSLVTGVLRPKQSAEYLREPHSACGPSAKWWKAK